MSTPNTWDFDHLFAHLASLGAIMGTMMGSMPEAAAFIAFLWYIIQIWESKTIQGWVHHATPAEVVAKAVLAKAAGVAVDKVANAKEVAADKIDTATTEAARILAAAPKP